MCFIFNTVSAKDLFEYGGVKIYGEAKNYEDGYDNNGRPLEHWNTKSGLTRTYVTTYMNFSEDSKVRLTLDSGGFRKHSSGFYKSSWVFVKYLYWEVKGYGGIDKILVGQHPNPWISYEDKIWGYRFISKSLLDDQQITHSADRGIGFIGSPQEDFEYAVSFVSGEGYKHDDANAVINTEGRITYDLGKGFFFSLGAGTGSKAETWPYDKYYTFKYGASNISYKVAPFIVSYTGLNTYTETDLSGETIGKGSNFTSVVNVWEGIDLIGRIDKLDGDIKTPDDISTKTIAGAAYKFDKNFKIALTKQTTASETNNVANHINYFNLEWRF